MGNRARYLLIALLGFPVLAEQLEFNRIKQADQTLLSWIWKDAEGDQHYLKASLDTQALLNASRGARKFKLRHLSETLTQAARRAEAQLPAGVNLRLAHSGYSYETFLSGSDPERVRLAEEELYQILIQAETDYLAERHLVRFITPHGQSYVIPDHLYYAFEGISQLYPLLESLRDQVNLLPPHLTIERILSFVQSIPEETYDIEGSSYRSPLAVLKDNQADVASKATLAVAMIRSFYPTRPISLMYTPEGLLIGVQINYDVKGITYYDGEDVWLCGEVSTPKNLGLGQLTRASLQALNSHSVRVVRLP